MQAARTWTPEFLVDDEAPPPEGKPHPGDWLMRDEHQHLTVGGGRGDEAIPIAVGDTFDFLGSTDGKEDDFATRFKLVESDGSLTFVEYDARKAEQDAMVERERARLSNWKDGRGYTDDE